MSDKERVERLGVRIVMALSAEGQLIALLDEDWAIDRGIAARHRKTSAEP
jgi:hypothetical protein